MLHAKIIPGLYAHSSYEYICIHMHHTYIYRVNQKNVCLHFEAMKIFQLLKKKKHTEVLLKYWSCEYLKLVRQKLRNLTGACK